MEHPEQLRPGTTRDELTAAAAKQFASLAERLRDRGHEPHEVAHFLNKLLFCMFAEDAGLLPGGLLARLAAAANSDPAVFEGGLSDLFAKMSQGGGLFGAERIEWFDGGLFDSGAVLELDAGQIRLVGVLDPACGSGNFLYLALLALKDLEREAILWGSLTLKIPMEFPQIGPAAVIGIECNAYAAELARVVIWIGEIQWMLAHGFAYLRDPILKPLDSIREADAVLDVSDPACP